jgi:tetratricopeptide (TPR) repeat protein
MVMAEDHVVFDVRKSDGEVVQAKRSERKTPELWQRWNDYGIGMLLAGKSQLRQAAEAFRQVEKLGRYDGPLNLGRVQFAEGDLDGATESLQRAANMDPAPPAWTLAWLSGEVSRQQGQLEDAAASFRSVLEDDTAERRQRKFDFSFDYRVRNSLGGTLIDLAEVAAARQQPERSDGLLLEAEQEFLKVLDIDKENVTAHANLAAIYQQRGDLEKAKLHSDLQLKYKMDDNAVDVAIPEGRRRYPAANHAAEPLVIYSLHGNQP